MAESMILVRTPDGGSKFVPESSLTTEQKRQNWVLPSTTPMIGRQVGGQTITAQVTQINPSEAAAREGPEYYSGTQSVGTRSDIQTRLVREAKSGGPTAERAKQELVALSGPPKTTSLEQGPMVEASIGQGKTMMLPESQTQTFVRPSGEAFRVPTGGMFSPFMTEQGQTYSTTRSERITSEASLQSAEEQRVGKVNAFFGQPRSASEVASALKSGEIKLNPEELSSYYGSLATEQKKIGTALKAQQEDVLAPRLFGIKLPNWAAITQPKLMKAILAPEPPRERLYTRQELEGKLAFKAFEESLAESTIISIAGLGVAGTLSKAVLVAEKAGTIGRIASTGYKVAGGVAFATYAGGVGLAAYEVGKGVGQASRGEPVNKIQIASSAGFLIGSIVPLGVYTSAQIDASRRRATYSVTEADTTIMDGRAKGTGTAKSLTFKNALSRTERAELAQSEYLGLRQRGLKPESTTSQRFTFTAEESKFTSRKLVGTVFEYSPRGEILPGAKPQNIVIQTGGKTIKGQAIDIGKIVTSEGKTIVKTAYYTETPGRFTTVTKTGVAITRLGATSEEFGKGFTQQTPTPLSRLFKLTPLKAEMEYTATSREGITRSTQQDFLVGTQQIRSIQDVSVTLRTPGGNKIPLGTGSKTPFPTGKTSEIATITKPTTGGSGGSGGTTQVMGQISLGISGVASSVTAGIVAVPSKTTFRTPMAIPRTEEKSKLVMMPSAKAGLETTQISRQRPTSQQKSNFSRAITSSRSISPGISTTTLTSIGTTTTQPPGVTTDSFLRIQPVVTQPPTAQTPILGGFGSGSLSGIGFPGFPTLPGFGGGESRSGRGRRTKVEYAPTILGKFLRKKISAQKASKGLARGFTGIEIRSPIGRKRKKRQSK